MPSLIYNSAIEFEAKGLIDYDTDLVKVMITTSAYVENKAHDFRNDITNEVVGTGYTAGGNTVAVTVTLDAANDRVNIVFAATSWPVSTITGRKAVYYKSRGGASSADEVIAVRDFGADVVSAAATFNLNALTIRKQRT